MEEEGWGSSGGGGGGGGLVVAGEGRGTRVLLDEARERPGISSAEGRARKGDAPLPDHKGGHRGDLGAGCDLAG